MFSNGFYLIDEQKYILLQYYVIKGTILTFFNTFVHN